MSHYDEQPIPWAEDELKELVKLKDLGPTALARRIKSLLERVEAEKSAKTSPGTQAFNTYELAEMILENLPLADLSKAQRICEGARDVVQDSSRIRPSLCVYTSTLDNNQLFKTGIVFDSTTDGGEGPYFCCINRPTVLSNVAGSRKSLTLSYELRFNATPEPGSAKRDKNVVRDLRRWSKQAIITPRQAYSSPVNHSTSPNDLPEELWRSVTWAKDVDEVRVHLWHEYDYRCAYHSRMSWYKKTFSGEPSLAETHEWMLEVAVGHS